MKVYQHISEAEALALYDAYLAGRLPKVGTILAEGTTLLFFDAPLPEGRDVFVSFGPVARLRTTLKDSQALTAWRAYADNRPVPAFASVIVTPSGACAIGRKDFEGGTPLLFPPSLLREVMTSAEAATIFSLPEKEITEAIKRGAFKNDEARKSGPAYLVTRRGMERVFEEKESELYPLSPLRVIYTTAEAAELWGRDAGYVRASAGGAGHMAARMHEEERRKSGRIWLVTREAMERAFGFPDVKKMRTLSESLEGRSCR